jgi:metallopeptidase MepB
MAKTPKTVLDFLGNLRTQLTIGGVKEIKHLKDLKKQDCKSCCLKLNGNYYL